MKKLSAVVLVALALLLSVLLTSCSMEDVCGNVTGYYEDCNVTGYDGCIYYLEIDGKAQSVNYSTWIESRLDDEICIGY
jgi:hypothetical protein